MSGLGLSGGLVGFALLVFTAYVAVLLGLAYDGWRSNTSLRDYVLGSKKLNGFVVGLSFGATYASANMFMGVPGMAYSFGTPALWWSTIGFGLPFLGIALFAKRFWLLSRLGVGDMTLPEWMAARYRSPYIRFGSSVLSMFLVFYIAGQFVGAATMFEEVFGTHYLVGLVAAAVIVTFYVAIGGMQTSIMTDFFQAVLMLVFAVVTFASIFFVIDGGITGLVATLAAESGTPGGATWFHPDQFIFSGPFGVGVMSWFLLAFILMPHLMNRVLVLDDRRELKNFVFGAGISLFGMSVFMIWAGLAGRAMFGAGQINPDSVVPLYLMEALPAWLAILIIVGILSAILTTADSLLHAMTTVIQQDAYKETWLRKIRGKDDDVLSSARIDRRATRIGQLASIMISLAAIYIGIERPASLFMLTQVGIAGFLSGATIPVILGYYWSGTTKRGAEAAFTVGTAVYILLFFDPFSLAISAQNQFLSFLYATVASVIACVPVSLSTEESVAKQQAVAFRRDVADGAGPAKGDD